MSADQKAIVSLSEDFGALVVQGPNIKVEIFPNGNVNVHTAGRVTTTDLSPTADASVEALKIGAALPDGSIYAGISPDTGRPIFTTRRDAPLTLNFGEAAECAKRLDSHGRKDWRVPTKAELNVLFENRAAIGGFDTSDADPYGWYWSSMCSDGYYALAQRFSDGYESVSSRYLESALRCVRG
jgi:hypothetical protein